MLRNKNTGRYRYFHSSFNCCGRYLDEPSLVTNSQDFETFLQRIRLPDVLQWVGSQRPNSAWFVEIVTNATFFINKIIDHPIGCVNTILPPYLKRNKAVITLESITNATTTICVSFAVWLFIEGPTFVVWNLPFVVWNLRRLWCRRAHARVCWCPTRRLLPRGNNIFHKHISIHTSRNKRREGGC